MLLGTRFMVIESYLPRLIAIKPDAHPTFCMLVSPAGRVQPPLP